MPSQQALSQNLYKTVEPALHFFPRSMAAAQTEPAVARSADGAALERYASCLLLGEGDVLRGLDLLFDREAAAARRHHQQGAGAAAGGGTGSTTRASRRREQRRRQAMRADTSGGRGRAARGRS